ncbi:serine carboxypeptidase-like 26 isoform X2 [Daucus carota subsp. sativus]|uniref:serine carboxypeptidase-like 26 isoform X2 n=1 Tax=Daucus carota subsp. sativus TaxID=79200 RepID=UPI0007EF5B11|nr:PREDICTED: serine carboxypeptidase-like 33 isoform X2 [Daucus carota subsp. sativus]
MTGSSVLSVLCIYVVLTFGSFITVIKSLETQTQSHEHYSYDRVINLPGQPLTPSVSQFSGYITVNKDHGRALFYWFFEAQSHPSKKPLLLWLNGGPGCSSIGYGAAVELGPLKVNKNGGLNFNPHSWNKEANLLFVESPVGVGFSYTNTSSDLDILDDQFVAEDTYNFLVNWLQRYSQWSSHDFYISGESYAGHYVPQLAELIHNRNKDISENPFINLKGFIVGNPETDDSYDYRGILEYAWSHSVIPDEVYDTAKNVCNFENNNWSKECNAAMEIVFDKYKEIDIYNIYAPICLINTTSSVVGSDSHVSSFKDYKRPIRIPAGYDPCYTPYVQEYFNRTDVKKAFHANTSIDYKVCSDHVFNLYNYTISSILPIYTELIKSGLKIWIYSGDADGRVPVIGSRYCIEALGLPLKSPWRSWFHNQQVGGRIVEYEGLTMVTVRGAGHLVPLNKPSEALSLIHSFLSGQPLPKDR